MVSEMILRAIALLNGLIVLSISSLYGLEDFRPMVQQAVNEGKTKITIPAGSYRLAPVGAEKCIWTLRGAKNLHIEAKGVTFVATKLTRALELRDCSQVAIHGLTIDYDPLPFTQGTVTAIDPENHWIDVQLHAGYPHEAYARIDLLDPNTRHRKRDMPFLWGTTAELRDDGIVRVKLKNIGASAELGDLASLSTGAENDGIPHAMTIENCVGISLDNVTIHSAPGMGMLECDGDGKSSYRNCRIVPGPKPVGAMEDRLLSSSWDAMQTKTVRHGPLVENCTISHAGDDSWSVQSSDFLVVATEGNSAVLAFRDAGTAGPQIGDRLTKSLIDKNVIIVTSKNVALKQPNISEEAERKLTQAPAYSAWSCSQKAISITVEGDFPYAVGTALYCPDRQANGFTFRNNRITSPGRILIKASDGTIENNQIIGAHAGVTICPEIPDSGAFGIENIMIRGNTFRGTGYYCPSWWNTQAGCISITASAPNKSFQAAGAMSNIRIENNRFEDINGAAIVASSTQGLHIRNNTFAACMTSKPNESGGSYGIDGHALIWLSNTKDIHIHQNRVLRPGSFQKEILAGKNIDETERTTGIHGVLLEK